MGVFDLKIHDIKRTGFMLFSLNNGSIHVCHGV